MHLTGSINWYTLRVYRKKGFQANAPKPWEKGCCLLRQPIKRLLLAVVPRFCPILERMLATLFLLSAILLGTTLTYALPLRLFFAERFLIGVPLGLAVSGLVGFVGALSFGLTETVVAGLVGIAVLATIAPWAARPDWRKRLGADLRGSLDPLRHPKTVAVALVFLVFAFALGLILSHAIFIQNGTVWAAFTNVWGDWNQHLSQTTGFAYGANFPPELTVMSGQRLSYPFMTNFISALLIKGGYPLVTAMVLPGVLLVISALGLIMALTQRLAGKAAAILAPFLFFLAGGLGFINFFVDLAGSDQSLGALFANLPHTYSQTEEGVTLSHIGFINPIFAYVVPQRAFLFGLPLVLTILILLLEGLRTKQRGPLLAAGLVATLLPLIHTHGFLVVGFISLLLLVQTRRRIGKDWMAVGRFWWPFYLPIIALALPQFFWLTAGLSTRKYFHLQTGWTAYRDNVVWFWFKNLGLFLPLLGIALVKLRKSYPLTVAFTIASGGVFLIANTFVFQPWDWDNTKLLVYWFVTSIPLVALFLVQLARRGRAWRWGVATMLVSLTLAGALDVSRTLQWGAYKLPLFNQADQDTAAYVAATAAPDAVFLTSQDANNPISGLTGRRIVEGYPGWLWSYGLDYLPRDHDVQMMLKGESETPRLLAKYHVDYVVVGARERAGSTKLNEPYYRTRYHVWMQRGETTIYDISQPLKAEAAASSAG